MAIDLTEKQERILRAFQRQVTRLRNSSVIKQQKVAVKKSFGIDLATGEATVTFTGYDPELFQSQLPILRQFLMIKEDIFFSRVCSVIEEKCQRSELVEWSTEAMRLWDETLKKVPGESEQRLLQVGTTLKDAFDNLFYGFGGLFHADINRPDEQASVEAIEGALMHSSFPDLFRCLNIVDSVIWWWLDETNADVPTVAEINAKKNVSSAESMEGDD